MTSTGLGGLGWPDGGAGGAPTGADVAAPAEGLDRRPGWLPASAGDATGLGWAAVPLPPFRVGEGAPLHPDGA